MKRNYKVFSCGIVAIFIVFVAVLMASHFNVKKVRASVADNLSGWAFSDMPDGSDSDIVGEGQTGKGAYWISFNPNANYGVNVGADGTISGYAWANPNDGPIENIGWISFMSADVAGCPSGLCQPTLDRTTGVVDGWAKALWADGNGWDGWIHLKGPTYGVTVSGCNWGGYAWGDNVLGWIHFKGPTYGVQGTGNACTASNVPPLVDAGPDQNVVFPASATLNGVITDDGLPNPPGAVTALWSKVIGPGMVTFGDASSAIATASFSVAGTYVLRLTGSDSVLSNSDDVSITVNTAPVFNYNLSNSGPKSVIQRQSVQNLITANLLSGTAERIDFSVPGLPGATLSFSNPPFCNPNWSNCSKTLTINTTLSTPPGDYMIIVSGISVALTRTTQFVLTVNQAPPCADGIDNDGDLAYPGGGIDAADPSCTQSGGTTEYSQCNDKNADGTLRDNDGDVDANIDDKGCHSDGNPNNPGSYDPNDNDESDTIFREVFVPFEKLLAMLFMRF